MSTFRPGSHGSSSRVPSSKNTSPEKKPSLSARVIRWTAVQIVSFVLAVLILGIGYAAVTWTNIPSGSGAAGQPVTQTLIQGIINNMNYLSGITSTLNTTITAVNTQLDTVNPSGTTLSGSKVCINGNCKMDWSAGGAIACFWSGLRWHKGVQGAGDDYYWCCEGGYLTKIGLEGDGNICP